MVADIKLYISLALIGWAAYKFFTILFARSEDVKSLQWASNSTPAKANSKLIEASRNLAHQFTIQHAVKIKNPRYRKNIERMILTSGLKGIINEDEFIAMQLLWGVMMPFVFLILNFTLQLGYSPVVFILFGAVGYFVPGFYARSEKKRRSLAVVIDLPFFVDLLALSVEAGLDFSTSIQRLVEKSRGKSVLADELEMVLRDITVGASRAEALRNLSNRLDLAEVTSLCNVVIDSESTGSSIVKVLKDQSNQMRSERFSRAEKAGAQASQAILVPMVIFILPALMLIIFAPLILGMIYGK